MRNQMDEAASTQREFDVVALRRAPDDEDPRTNQWELGLSLGLRLARLAAEAPVGTGLTITTRSRDAHLQITVAAVLTAHDYTPRAGLPTAVDALDHLAHECAGLIDGYAALSDLRAGVRPASAPRPALQILPRGRSKGLRPLGFPGWGQDQDGMWAVPQPSDAAEFARLLLTYPHLALVQSVAPISEDAVEEARRDLADAVPLDSRRVVEALGTPVRVQAVLYAEGTPWTLPLRVREHLRGWFSILDLEEAALAEPTPGLVVPEFVAAGLLRFPTTVLGSFPGLPVVPTTVPIDSAAEPRPGIRVGVAHDLRMRPVEVTIDEEAMSRHVHVIGESGSGKSTLLAAVAAETARTGGGLLLLDPHGTTVDRVLRELPAEARDRTWVIRCGDTRNPTRLNPFAIDDPELQDIVISDMLEVLQALFDPNHQGFVGPRFQHVVRHVLSTLAELRADRTSILDVSRLLYDVPLRKAAVERLQDPELKAFWANDIAGNRSTDLNDLIAWVGSKFTSLASNKAVKEMLASGADSFDPLEAMSANRIILVDLDKGAVGSMGAKMIGLLYLLRFWVAALGRPEPEPFTILVDEAATFSAVALPSILSEGRKFGLRALVAHQYMGQLEPGLADAIEGSTATRLVFRVGPEDARDLAVSTWPEFTPRDLSAMPQFVAAMRLADSGAALRPFTLTVDHSHRHQAESDWAEAVTEIEARSIRDLVDPHRDAAPMTLADLAATAPPVAKRAVSGSFLDDWLAAREPARRPEPDPT